MALRLLAAALFGTAVFAGEWVVVTPARTPSRAELERWRTVLDNAERVVADCFESESGRQMLGMDAGRPRVLRVAASSAEFAALTGCSVWQGAALKNGELIVQPLAVLERRGVTEEVMVHEFVHIVLEPYDVPLWLNEGLAVICSGQVRRLGGEKNLPRDTQEIEMLLESSDTSRLRLGYLAAAALTQETINRIGRDSLVRLIKEEAL